MRQLKNGTLLYVYKSLIFTFYLEYKHYDHIFLISNLKFINNFNDDFVKKLSEDMLDKKNCSF